MVNFDHKQAEQRASSILLAVLFAWSLSALPEEAFRLGSSSAARVNTERVSSASESNTGLEQAAGQTQAEPESSDDAGRISEKQKSKSSQEDVALREGQALDINQAGLESLMLLPRIGPKRAQAIVALRSRRGCFRKVRELALVRGIGPKTLLQLKALIRVSPCSAAKGSQSNNSQPNKR